MYFGVLKASANSQYISELHAIMTNISLCSGYSASRMKNSVDSLLLKKKGEYQADKRYTIVVLEPDFNYFKKIVRLELLARAEKYCHLANEQYSSSRNHSAINQAVNKTLTFDMLEQKRLKGFLCMTDENSV